MILLTLGLSVCVLACDDQSSQGDGPEVSPRRDGSPSLRVDAGAPDGGQDALPPLLNDATPTGSDAQAGDGGMVCAPDSVDGCVDLNTRRVCDAIGSGYIGRACAPGERCRDGECEPGECAEGFRVCINDTTIGECRLDQGGYVPVGECRSGSVCMGGTCESDCNVDGKVPSNVGCEYWSVDLDNYPDPFSNDPSSVPHAVAISNTSEHEATVTIEGPPGVALQRPQFNIPAGDVFVYTFPRLDIDGTGIFDRAFRIRSTWPVIVYQFNPLNNEGVASNDASLLLPAEGLGQEYVAMSWPSSPVPCFEDPPMNCLPPQNGYVTVVATSRGNTVVRVRPTAVVEAGVDVDQLEVGVEHEFNLSQGQVLNLQALAPEFGELLPPCETDDDCMNGGCLAGICLGDIGQAPPADLTGSVITASQPVAVFGGHEEAVVGEGCCAEHLEQQLFPVSTWGQRYLAARSEPRGGSVEHWRVVAATDGTVITTDPPQPDSGQFTLNRGEFHEIVSQDSFEISATAPVMVGQYLISQEGTGDNVGDPALILAPPLEQLRSDYQVITPEGYSSNWLTIARLAGEAVTLDDAVLPNNRFRAFGSGQFEFAWIQVEAGVHHLSSEQPFSLSVYGYSGAVSYGYPGGLNLRTDETP